MKRLFCSLIALGFLLLPQMAYPWGNTGHRIVGQIAQNHLSQEARAGIRELIGNQTLAQVSNWADHIKSDKQWNPSRHNCGQQSEKPWDTPTNNTCWHYFSIGDNEAIDQDSIYNRKKLANGDTPFPSGNILLKIDQCKTVLRDKAVPKKDREIALKFLVHLMGDVVQPMHLGRANDRGGNNIKLMWMYSNKSNLHRVWDSDMINHSNLSYTEYANFLEANMTEEKKAKWGATTLLDLVADSQSLRTQVYDLEPGRDGGLPVVGWNYVHDNSELLDKRLGMGGIMLAKMLNDIFPAP